MGSYSDLVSKVLKNDVLAKAAKEMSTIQSSDKSTLDLVSTDWAYRLENDIVFQDFQFNPNHVGRSTSSSINYEYETSKGVLFEVTLAGLCRFAKPYKGKPSSSPPSIIISNSEPLSKIAKVMTKDYGLNITISDEFKFQFNPCGILICKFCSDSAEKIRKLGYKLNKHNQPCIRNTFVYDGENIVNRFLSHIEESYPQNFMALVHLRINTRYNYTDQNNLNQKIHRIGGTVTNIIVFDEVKLYSYKPVNLGNLTFIELPKESETSVCKNSEHKSNINEPELEESTIPDFLHPTEEQKECLTNKVSKVDDYGVIDDTINDNTLDDLSLLEKEKQDVPPSKRPKVEESFSFII